MSKKLLDTAETFAKAIGAQRVCRKCTPFIRAQLAGRPSDHLQCDDSECGCRCQDEARKN